MSKTINLPHNASVRDVREVYLQAHALRCKGINIYRYGSKQQQVLNFGGMRQNSSEQRDIVSAESEYSGGCATGTCSF